MVLMNLTAGGLLGYCSSNCITKRKVPSSNGVSAGPIITAFLHLQREDQVSKEHFEGLLDGAEILTKS
jgi:hypothetical protein